MNHPVPVKHPFAPVYNSESRILILGSLPSVQSRAVHFYYGHPRNRFWKMLAAILHTSVPETVEQKKELLLSHGIALYDAIAQCEIRGSSDASIRNVIPADLTPILQNAPIQAILCNGKAALKYYQRYQQPVTGIEAVGLPSTSPANASCSLEALVEAWKPAILAGTLPISRDPTENPDRRQGEPAES